MRTAQASPELLSTSRSSARCRSTSRARSHDTLTREIEGRMNLVRVAAAAIAAFAAYFILGGAVFTSSAMRAEFARFGAVYRTQESMKPVMPLGMLGMLLSMMALTVLFAMIHPAGAGITAGVQFGLLVALYALGSFVLHNHVESEYWCATDDVSGHRLQRAVVGSRHRDQFGISRLSASSRGGVRSPRRAPSIAFRHGQSNVKIGVVRRGARRRALLRLDRRAKKTFDDATWLQELSPRGTRSIWSRSTASAYDSHRSAGVPDDLLRALDAHPKAMAFFATLK